MKPNKTFIIQHKETKERLKIGKGSWKSTGHAKNSWRQSGAWKREQLSETFDYQDVYEVVEVVPEERILLSECTELLLDCTKVLSECLEELEALYLTYPEEVNNPLLNKVDKILNS